MRRLSKYYNDVLNILSVKTDVIVLPDKIQELFNTICFEIPEIAFFTVPGAGGFDDFLLLTSP